MPIAWLNAAMTTPVDTDCFEYCNLSQRLAAFAFRLVGVLWLWGLLVVAWRWRDREPTVAAVSAIAASLSLVIVVAGLVYLGRGHLITEDQVLLAWVVSLGLQVSPIWRLSRRAPPSTPLRTVVGVMNVAVAGAAVSIVLFGADFMWSAGPYGVLAAWVVFQVGVLLIGSAAWRDRVMPRPVAGPLIVASLPVLLVPVGIVAPGPIAYVILLAFPLTTIAWLWIAWAWLRGVGTSTPIDPALTVSGGAEAALGRR